MVKRSGSSRRRPIASFLAATLTASCVSTDADRNPTPEPVAENRTGAFSPDDFQTTFDPLPSTIPTGTAPFVRVIEIGPRTLCVYATADGEQVAPAPHDSACPEHLR